jgi:hypothetical protein
MKEVEQRMEQLPRGLRRGGISNCLILYPLFLSFSRREKGRFFNYLSNIQLTSNTNPLPLSFMPGA